jgi:hypothetical protein
MPASSSTDAGLSEPIREEALKLAEPFPENANALNYASWTVVCNPGADGASYKWALDRSALELPYCGWKMAGKPSPLKSPTTTGPTSEPAA